MPRREAETIRIHGEIISDAQIKGSKKRGKYTEFEFATDRPSYSILQD
ncbi:MAG: hypothetical protein AAGG68_03810 [Bacteroidota bacterium]